MSRRAARQMLEYLEEQANEWRKCIGAMTPTERNHVRQDVTTFVQYVQTQLASTLMSHDTSRKGLFLKCAVTVHLINLNRLY